MKQTLRLLCYGEFSIHPERRSMSAYLLGEAHFQPPPAAWPSVEVDHSLHSRTAVRARSIPLYLALTCLTIAAGLASRRYPEFLPTFVARYAGDTLWAAMVFWFLALCWRRASTRRLAASAIVVAFAVECSQLYHAAWIDSIRETRIGALILGSDFAWSDLVCYAVGVCIALVLDALLAERDNTMF